jgi:hypothetical protein
MSNLQEYYSLKVSKCILNPLHGLYQQFITGGIRKTNAVFIAKC